MTRYPIWRILYPELTDYDWIISKLEAGGSQISIAAELGCSPKTVRAAQRALGIPTGPYIILKNPKLIEFEKRIPK